MRAVLYARVSTEEQTEGYSLDAQSRAFRQLCESRGWEVAREYVEEGRSARTEDVRKRPVFRQMMADAHSGAFDVLVVHKLDRFARNRRVAFESFDDLGRHHVSFLSISENMDFSSAWGQLALTLLVGLAQFYSDNLSQETKKGKQERKRQGIYNGLLPFGYVKPDGDDKLPISHPTNLAGLLLAFEECAGGKSDAEIAAVLNARGHRTSGNRGVNLFTKDTVRRILLNRFYLGELPDGKGGWVPGKHQPILELDLFERAQAARAENRTNQGSASVVPGRQTYALSGLLYCGHCLDAGRKGAKVQVSMQNGTARAYCYNRTQTHDCLARSVVASVYEGQFELWLAHIAAPDDLVEQGLAQLARERGSEAPDERRRLQARLDRLKELYSWGDLDRAEYQAERDSIGARLRALQPVAHQRRDLEKIGAQLRGVHLTWQRVGSKDRNELACGLVQKIVVKDGRVEAIIPRPDVAPWVPAWTPSWWGGSDGRRSSTTMRYHEPHNLLPISLLREVAAAEGYVLDVARRYGVARQTVRRARAMYG